MYLDQVENKKEDIILKKKLMQIKDDLNHPVKLQILNYLAEHKSASLGCVIKALRISSARGLKYINDLIRLGLVESHTDPPEYNINQAQYDRARSIFNDIIK